MTMPLPKTRLGKRSPMGALVMSPCPMTEVRWGKQDGWKQVVGPFLCVANPKCTFRYGDAVP